MRLLLLLLLLAVLGAQPAAGAPPIAHPFGPPPSARIRADGPTVIIDWTSAADDAIAVGEQLGVLPEGSTQAYREGAAVTQVAPSVESEQQLARSPELQRYLLDRLTVQQDGQPCAAEVAPIENFVANGARVIATCPRPVSQVDITIAMLTDIHTAYRTFAVGQGSTPQQFVYTMRQPSQAWRFGVASPAEGPSSPAVLAGAAVAAVAGSGLLVWWLLRRRRRAGAVEP